MRRRYLRQIIYIKGRVLKFWKQTGCPLLFRNTFCPFSYERCMAWRELKRGGVRLKPVHLILSKHRPPPLWEAHKHSDIHSYTHTRTILLAYTHNLQFVWFGIALSSHRALGRRKKDFPRQTLSLFSSGKFCRLREVVQLWSVIPQVAIT